MQPEVQWRLNMNINSTQSSLCEYWIYRRSDFNMLKRGLCIEPDITVDYLSKQIINLNISDSHTLGQYSNDFIVLKKGRSEIFVGVITAYSDVQNLELVSLLDYMDFPMHIAESTSTVFWSEYTYNVLSAQFVSNPDTLQNIPNLTITYEDNSTDISGRYTSENTDQIQFQEFRQWLFKKHNIIIDVTFSHNAKTIAINVAPNTTSERGVNVSLFDVTNVVNIDFSMQTNKLIVYSKVSDAETGITTYSLLNTYYLLSDGTTTTDPSASGRLTPIVQQIVYCDPADESDVVETNLTSWEYNEELSFDVLNESNILDVQSYHIGDPIKLHYGNYISVRTKISGIHRGELYTTFTCGINRYTLENYLRTKGKW